MTDSVKFVDHSTRNLLFLFTTMPLAIAGCESVSDDTLEPEPAELPPHAASAENLAIPPASATPPAAPVPPVTSAPVTAPVDPPPTAPPAAAPPAAAPDDDAPTAF